MPKKRELSLEQEYRYQAGKRSSWDFASGLPSAAAAGDRDALKKCAGMAGVLVRQMEVREDLAGVVEWLSFVLSELHAGQSPDEAFGWGRDAHRPREFKTIFKQWVIGQHMDSLINGPEPMTIDAASVIVGEQRHVTAGYAKECYQNFREAGA